MTPRTFSDLPTRRGWAWIAAILFCQAIGLLIFVSVVPRARAAQVEVGIGIAQAQTNGDGTWYQTAFAHQLQLRDTAAMIGLTGSLSPHFRWHLDAVDLGSYRVNSWDTPNDANYSGSGYAGTPLPLTNYIGHGGVYGFAATLEAHSLGNLQFGVEAGPFLYHATWALDVPDWYPSAQVQPHVFKQVGAVQPISCAQSHWALGAVVGLNMHQGSWTLSLRRYFDGKGFAGHGTDPWPPLWKSQTVAMVAYTF